MSALAASASANPDLGPLRAEIAAYYSGKIARFGATPLGVDWTCVPTQQMRMVQLLKLCDFRLPFSLNDLGCGYGALIAYLDQWHQGHPIDYVGADLSAAMLRHARRLWHGRNCVRFVMGHASPRIADYSVASGIFNVQLDQPRSRWEEFIGDTLHGLHRTSAKGFAVNFVSADAYGTAAPAALYTTKPERWTQYCAAQFGSRAQVIDGYGLREFTLIVRPEGIDA
jgi:SAM-dependent methyltransferase